MLSIFRIFKFASFLACIFSAQVWASEPLPPPLPSPYRVSVGDELDFRFFYMPELNTVAAVRADGRVSLPLVGEVAVDGLTVSELIVRVETSMATQIRRPQVMINVQGGGSQRIFVGGEVVRPGVQPLKGPLSVVQAVMVAEGVKDSAQTEEVLVLRRGPSDARQVIRVDLAAAMSGKDLSQDLVLQPYDVVIVPRSGIASVGLWVDQYVKRVIPFSLGFSYTINRNASIQ
jgi:polysaccharide biosynthesis/export protein